MIGSHVRSGPCGSGPCDRIDIRETAVPRILRKGASMSEELGCREAIDEFRKCVEQGFSIRKIRETLADLGHSLDEHSDVELIRLWREFSPAK